MRIICPACAASYDVPDAMLGVGRSVRCARCLREWQPARSAAVAYPLLDPPQSRAAWPETTTPPDPPEDASAPMPGDADFEHDRLGRVLFEDADDGVMPFPAAPPAHPSLEPGHLEEEHGWRGVLLADDGPAAAPAAPGRSDGWMGWLASLVVLAALGWAAVAYRADVQRAWPPSARLYTALGLHARA